MTVKFSDQEIIAVLNKMFSSAENECRLDLLDDIQQELQDIVDKFCFPGSQQIRTEIRNFENSLRDLILFPEFANRYIIALGGSFNSGKSSILNCLFGYDFLPVGNTPTTSIPTIIIPSHKDDPVFSWCDHLGKYHSIAKDDFEKISHDFRSPSWKECSLLPLISSLRCLLPAEEPYDNLVFLDTPGIGSKAGEDLDKKNAREMIQRSDALIWVICFHQGTVTKSDLDFCRAVLSEDSDKEKPVFLLINIWNPDQTQEDVQKKIMEDIKKEFSAFNVKGASVFSAEDNKTCQGDSPRDWFSRLNDRPPKRAHLYEHINAIMNDIESTLEKNIEELQSLGQKAAQEVDGDKPNIEVPKYFWDHKDSRKELLEELNKSRAELSRLLQKFLDDLGIKDEITHPSNAYGVYYSKNIESFSKGYTTVGKITLEIPELDKCIITCQDNEGHTLELLAEMSKLKGCTSDLTVRWITSDGRSNLFRLENNDNSIDFRSSDHSSEPENETFSMRYLYFFCLSAMILSCEHTDTFDDNLEKIAESMQIPGNEITYILQRCKEKDSAGNSDRYLFKLKTAKLLPSLYADFVTLSNISSDKANEFLSHIEEKDDAENDSFYKDIRSYLTGKRFEFREKKSLVRNEFYPIWEKYTKVIDLDQIDELVSCPADNPEKKERADKISKEICWNIDTKKEIANHSFLFQGSGRILIEGTAPEKKDRRLTFDHCNFFFYDTAEKDDYLIYAKNCTLVFKNCCFFGNNQRGIIDFTSSFGCFNQVVFQNMKCSGYCINGGKKVSFTRCSFEECSGKYIVDEGRFRDSIFINCTAEKQLINSLSKEKESLYIKNCTEKSEKIQEIKPADDSWAMERYRFFPVHVQSEKIMVIREINRD